ncbi:basic salivary proline-rich protein 2-like [Dromiciops gliroides]|uniref:basic salivary proline-rich protein 2-like n=1 Tax=Dromiciops gliroides TaxID=33562 RepID=UPI001CC3638B|nr:basic salivary proline-rich protein 2-like [Dromiciops gliroides]
MGLKCGGPGVEHFPEGKTSPSQAEGPVSPSREEQFSPTAGREEPVPARVRGGGETGRARRRWTQATDAESPEAVRGIGRGNPKRGGRRTHPPSCPNPAQPPRAAAAEQQPPPPQRDPGAGPTRGLRRPRPLGLPSPPPSSDNLAPPHPPPPPLPALLPTPPHATPAPTGTPPSPGDPARSGKGTVTFRPTGGAPGPGVSLSSVPGGGFRYFE